MRPARKSNPPNRPTTPERALRRSSKWRAVRALALAVWGTYCWWCGHPGAHEADHLVPLSQGGDPYDIGNIRPSHGSNYPCPICIGERTGRPRCCNQERNRKPQVAIDPVYIDPTEI